MLSKMAANKEHHHSVMDIQLFMIICYISHSKFLSIYSCMCMQCVLIRFSCVQLFTTLLTVARQAPLSIGFPRQEYWSGLPFPPPGDLLNPGIKPASLVFPIVRTDSLQLAEPGAHICVCVCVCIYIYIYIYLLRNLYAGQEATVRTGHGTTDWLQVGKGVRQGCILSPCLFNFYAEYIMRNAGLEEAQAGIKTAGEKYQ